MPNDATLYECCRCEEPILGAVYEVQRRRIRPLREGNITNLPDLVDSSHAGVIVGPEFDYYCQTHFDLLPSIQELISKNKKNLERIQAVAHTMVPISPSVGEET